MEAGLGVRVVNPDRTPTDRGVLWTSRMSTTPSSPTPCAAPTTCKSGRGRRGRCAVGIGEARCRPVARCTVPRREPLPGLYRIAGPFPREECARRFHRQRLRGAFPPRNRVAAVKVRSPPGRAPDRSSVSASPMLARPRRPPRSVSAASRGDRDRPAPRRRAGVLRGSARSSACR